MPIRGATEMRRLDRRRGIDLRRRAHALRVSFLWQIPHFPAIARFLRRDYLAAGLKVLPKEHGEDATRRAISSARRSGAVRLGWGALGLIGRRDDGWARRLFGISVAYMPALFAILLLS